MPHDERPRAPRLATQFGQPRGDVDEQVRIRGQPSVDPVEIFGRAGRVGGDERRRRVGGDERLERLEQAVVVAGAEMRERPPGVGQQLLETLVGGVDRAEEGPRVGGVDEHRHACLRGDAPDRCQPLVVGQEQLAALVGEAEPEILPHLEPPGAGGQRAPQAARQALAESRRRRLGPVEVAEGREAARPASVVAPQVGLELVAPEPVEIDDRPHVDGVHVGQQARDVGHRPVSVGAEPAAEMVVGVDGGVGGALRAMFGSPQGRTRQIVAQPQVGEVAVRVGLSHAGDPTPLCAHGVASCTHLT